MADDELKANTIVLMSAGSCVRLTRRVRASAVPRRVDVALNAPASRAAAGVLPLDLEPEAIARRGHAFKDARLDLAANWGGHHASFRL